MTQSLSNSRLAAAAESFARRLLAVASSAARRGTDWFRDRRFVDEHDRLLDELEEKGEFEVLVELTGATREQLRGADISPLAAFELLHRMMGRLGVDTSDATSDVDAFAEGQWRCRLCTNWRQCRRWLDREVADESYRHFCSNATLLERMHARFQTVPTPEA